MILIARILSNILGLLYWAIIIECILSWIPSLRYNEFYTFLRSITEKIESPIRDVVYRYVQLPVDITPIIAIFLIRILQRAVWMLVF